VDAIQKALQDLRVDQCKILQDAVDNGKLQFDAMLKSVLPSIRKHGMLIDTIKNFKKNAYEQRKKYAEHLQLFCLVMHLVFTRGWVAAGVWLIGNEALRWIGTPMLRS
jgi:hypothetical protein